MILYFSATGNTGFIAEELANRLDDSTVNLLKRIREKDYSPITSEKPFVICVPVYVCEIPPFVCELIRKTPFEGNKNIYFIFTSGGYSGICSTMAKRLARQKGLNYMGSADFKMPRNYIANNTYPELTEDEIRRRIDVSYKLIPEISDLIRNGQKLVIGCRKCANLCPVRVISPDADGKPVWDAKMCAHCMSCIQNCPVEAIDYGDITPSKKRYTFGRYDFRKQKT